MIGIQRASFPRDVDDVRTLFREYAAGLGIDLGFQDFEAELAALPGKYAVPNGSLLLARGPNDVLGCVALRPLQGSACEMKRLYVRPQARGAELGRQLAERICREAREAGYSRICLDTLPTMATAQRLYQAMGFAPVEPYVFNPIPGTKFLALDLSGPAASVS